MLHIGFWICYLMIIAIMLGILYKDVIDENALESQIANTFGNIFFFALVPSFLSFYLFYFLLFPKYLIQKKIFYTILYGILMPLGSAFIGYLLMQYMMQMECISNLEPGEVSSPWQVILFMTFIALICGIVALVIRGFITWFEEIKLKEELRQKNHETEMALVKSQLDPHFLFNTINNIDVLILKNPIDASDYLNKLSDIMRFMLFETKPDKIPLAKELEYIEKYIALQKIRTANAHYVDFRVTGKVEHQTIAPMLFIPFIENAFKHTSNKKVEHAITIHITVSAETIEMNCENKYDPSRKSKQENSGLGNELIQKRLNLIYPEKHTLEVRNQNGIYSVHLILLNG